MCWTFVCKNKSRQINRVEFIEPDWWAAVVVITAHTVYDKVCKVYKVSGGNICLSAKWTPFTALLNWASKRRQCNSPVWRAYHRRTPAKRWVCWSSVVCITDCLSETLICLWWITVTVIQSLEYRKSDWWQTDAAVEWTIWLMKRLEFESKFFDYQHLFKSNLQYRYHQNPIIKSFPSFYQAFQTL